MNSAIRMKETMNLTKVITRNGILLFQNEQVQSDSYLTQITTSSCGAQSGQKSCWNVINQSYTCIPQSNICCGDGHSCSSDLRCSYDTCILVEQSYKLCPPVV